MLVEIDLEEVPLTLHHIHKLAHIDLNVPVKGAPGETGIPTSFSSSCDVTDTTFSN